MVETLADRVSQSLYLRKVYHMIGGGLLVLGVALVDRFWFAAIGAIYFAFLSIFGRRFSFAVVGVLALLMFTGSRLATMGGTVIWVVGDSLSAIVGSMSRRATGQKSLAGTLAFVFGASLAMLVLLHRVQITPIGIRAALVVIPSVVGSGVEALPARIFAGGRVNDNLPVILASGLAFHGLLCAFRLGAPR